MTWKDPVYRIREEYPLGSPNAREIVIDVTRSAPFLTEPSKEMVLVFDQICDEYLPKNAQVLDFGAGRLRNSMHFLRKGHSVCGVEFEALSTREDARDAYSKAARFRRFWQLQFPRDFLSLKQLAKFDLILCINVFNIMPIPAERTLALQLCRRALSDKGMLLWYTQHGKAAYRERCTDENRVGDGYFLRSLKKFKTFYREFSTGQINTLMVANGFTFVRSFRSGYTQIRLYRKGDSNPLEGFISLADVRSIVRPGASIALPGSTTPKTVAIGPDTPAVPANPDGVREEKGLAERLDEIPTGGDGARQYQDLAMAILGKVLDPERIHSIRKEVDIAEGLGRVDIIARPSQDGFFATLHQRWDVVAPHIIVECKNYSVDPKNPEFDQLKGRLNSKRGMFGLLLCRSVTDKKESLRRCHEALKDNKYIIVLEDKDLKQLLALKVKGQLSDIDRFFEDRMDELTL